MRLWIFNHYAIPPTQSGGTRHHALARELVRRGHEAVIFASSVDYLTGCQASLPPGEIFKQEVVEDVPFVRLRTPSYSGNSAGRLWNMTVFALRILQAADLPLTAAPPDIVIGSTPHLFAPLAAKYISARFGAPFVLEVRDLWPQSLVEVTAIHPRHPLVLAFEGIERHLYRTSDMIVTLLPAAVDHMVRKGANPKKLMWLPNGVDVNAIPHPRPPEPDRPFTVMYAGAHGVANGLDTILEAALVLEKEGLGDRVLFRFVGDGTEKPRLRHLAQKRVQRNVRFDDPVPKREVYGLLQEADALVATLRKLDLYKYGISLNKIYDYLAAARPVVFGTDAVNNPVAEAGAGLSIPPEDAHAMARAIRDLAAMDPGRRWEMGLRGRSYVEKYHDYRGLAVRLENRLLEIMDSKSRRLEENR